MTTTALVLSCVALALAVIALVLALLVMRQSATTTTDVRQHRRAHAVAYGTADPKLDRRQTNLGPPRAGERRGHRYEPDRERLAPRPDRLLEVDEPLTAEHAEQVRAEQPATSQIERQDLPTTAITAQRPDPARQDSGR